MNEEKTKREIETFCKNIRALRRHHSLTQREMAEILDVSVGAVRSLEGGIIPPRMKIDVLIRASRFFKLEINALLEEKQPS